MWRAANNVSDSDHRPTGPTQPAKAQARWQHELDARVGDASTATLADWTSLLHTLVPAARRDDFTSQLAQNLDQLARSGFDADTLLHTVTAAPLPDDHAASALWWRIQNHLPDPNRLGEPASLEWPPEDASTFPDHVTGLAAPRRSADHERRVTAVRPDQSRGPGMAR